MPYTMTRNPNYTVQVSGHLEAEVVEQERHQLLQTMRRSARVPGFRPGKAPLSLVRARPIGSVDDDELCAGGNGVNACSGDSGGPLWDPKTRTQYGIVSWGARDCSTYPTVFVRVSSYIWLVDAARMY